VELGATGAGVQPVAARQAPRSPRLDSTIKWELDLGMHRWEPGSGSQAGQGARPSSETTDEESKILMFLQL